MFKSTEDIESVFVKDTDKTQKKNKPKRKCSEQQLENLRRAREKAKANRERRKREKAEAKNKQLPVKNEIFKPTPEPVKTEPIKEPVKEPVKTTETPKQHDIKIIRNNKSSLRDFLSEEMMKGNNPLNINYTEIIKHQMTLQHQTRLNRNRRPTLRRQQAVRQQPKQRVTRQQPRQQPKPQPKPQPTPPPTPQIRPPKNDFFSGLF